MERRADFSFAKAQRAKTPEGFFVNRRDRWSHRGSVRRAVRMAKDETGRDPAFDVELAAVLCAVMSTAENDHAIGIVVAAFRAKYDVVDVEKNAVSALGNHAPPAVAANDRATHRRASSLVCSRARAHVGGSRVIHFRVVRGFIRGGLQAAEALRIAARHVDERRTDFDRLAGALLPTAPAALAHGQRDLVAGSPGIDGPTQNMTREAQQSFVVVEGRDGVEAA